MDKQERDAIFHKLGLTLLPKLSELEARMTTLELVLTLSLIERDHRAGIVPSSDASVASKELSKLHGQIVVAVIARLRGINDPDPSFVAFEKYLTKVFCVDDLDVAAHAERQEATEKATIEAFEKHWRKR